MRSSQKRFPSIRPTQTSPWSNVRALVTSARAPQALTAIRELGRRGWQITAADNTRLSPGLYSRFADRQLILPSLTEEPEDYARLLTEELRQTEYDLLLPCFEEIFLIAKHQIPDHTRAFVDTYDKLISVHHKVQLTQVAKQLGIGTPETWQPKSREELEALIRDLPYPAVIKLPAANNSLGMGEADDAKSLSRKWQHLTKLYRLREDGLPIIQRKIRGEDLCTLAFAHRGELLGQMVYRSELMFPDGGGTAFVRQSVRHDELEMLSEKALADLEWTGFLGLDFLIDAQTNEPLLIDANPRPNPALGLAQRAGVDFVGILDALVRQRAPVRHVSPRPNVRTKTLFVHLLWMAFLLVPGRGWWTRAKRARASLSMRGLHPDIHDPKDRKPSWVMTLYVLYFMFIVNTLKPTTGGFMFGCNFNHDSLD